MRGSNAIRRRQRGSAMLELAFCFTVLMLAMLGLFELGRAVWAYNTVSHAARQAARYASLHAENEPASDQDVGNIAAANAIGLDAKNLTTSTTWMPDRSYGSLVQVEVEYALPLMLSPFILKSDTLTLGATGNSIVTQ
jgi:Flp pilus assembly protein TadG